MRSKGNKLMALFVAFSCLATASAIRAQEDRRVPPSKDLCYAFLRDHDIWTVCQGKRERIHMPYKVSGFALSADGSHFAYYTQKTSHGGKVLQRQDLMVISLEPGFEVAKHETGVVPRKLVATCGTILKSETNSLTDLLARDPSKLPPQSFFKCSSDRRVIAVWNRVTPPGRGNVVITVDGREKLKLPWGPGDLQISPSGKFLAYGNLVDDHFQDCITETDGRSFCTLNTDGNNRATESVSDAGEVLYTEDLKKFCGEFACTGIEYRHLGESKGEILEGDDSFDPQWITPRIAERLHQWGSSLASSAPQ